MNLESLVEPCEKCICSGAWQGPLLHILCSRHLCIPARRITTNNSCNVHGWTECRKCRSNFLSIVRGCNVAMRHYRGAIRGVAQLNQWMEPPFTDKDVVFKEIGNRYSGQLRNPG